MKKLSYTLLSLAALLTVVSSILYSLFGIAEGRRKAASLTQIPIFEHRLGMHGYDAPVHDKKAATTEDMINTEQISTELMTTEAVTTEFIVHEPVTTEAYADELITAEAVSTGQTAAEQTVPEQTATGQTAEAQTTTEQTATGQTTTEQTTAVQTEGAQTGEPSAPDFEYSSTGDLLAEVNSLRASYGLSPLAGDSLLDAAAAVRAAELTECMSHTRPDGRPAFSIVTDFGIPCSYRGENIAAGYALPCSVLAGWEESPSHLENLLNPVFTRAGISHTVTDTGYLDYWAILLSD